MNKTWGFSFEVTKFSAPAVCDLDDNTRITLPEPAVFEDGRLSVPRKSNGHPILNKSLINDYGYLVSSLEIKDESDRPQDIVSWLTDQSMSGRVELKFGFKKSRYSASSHRCFVDIIFQDMNHALLFQSSYGDYGLRVIDTTEK